MPAQEFKIEQQCNIRIINVSSCAYIKTLLSMVVNFVHSKTGKCRRFVQSKWRNERDRKTVWRKSHWIVTYYV